MADKNDASAGELKAVGAHVEDTSRITSATGTPQLAGHIKRSQSNNNEPKPHAGVGHNSKRGKSNSENGAETSLPETFPPSLMIARKAALELNGATIEAFRATYPRAVAFAHASYAAYCDLEAANKLEDYYQRHRIVAHGNADNPYQSFVKNLFEEMQGKHIRQTVWRVSSAFALAKSEGVTSENFINWLRDNGGLDNVAALYRTLKAQPKERNSWRAMEELAERVLIKDAPLSDATPVTYADQVGRKLAVVDLESNGQFRLQKLLPHSHRDITRILADVALGKFEEKKQ